MRRVLASRALRRPAPARADDADAVHRRARVLGGADGRRRTTRAATLGWMRLATPVWGFLAERIDRRIAVSEQARESAQRWLPGEYEIVPNGVLIPAEADAGGREHRIVFAGRQETRKGLRRAAARLAGDPAPHRRAAADRGRRPARGPAAARPAARVRRRHRRPRLPHPGRADRRARRREGARRAVARRGELRHGADARLRVRDAGRRVRHPRLSRRHDARDRRRRAAR